MAIIKRILYSSLFAACCAVGLSMATERLLLGERPYFFTFLHGFIAANTLCIYNIHYYVKNIQPGVSDRADWSRRHRWLHVFFIFGGAVFSLICLWFLPFKVICVSIFLGVLALGYSLPVLPFPQKKRLKDWGILKLILLSTVWTSVTVVMPMFYWNKRFEAYDVEFLLRFVFMLPLCIAFDIRDRDTDKENSIYTLPNAIGLSASYRLMYFCEFLFLTLAVWQYVRYPVLHRLISGIVIMSIASLVLFYSKKVKTDVFYLLFVDGMMLLYAALIFFS